MTGYEAIWPNLNVVSCWAHGHASHLVSSVRDRFPHAVLQPKGLLATEAFVSFPVQGEASALSLTSHFYEFESVDTGEIVCAHQVQTGKIYSVIVTTGGGLYRYRMNDNVEILGFVRECPLLRFVGRQDKVVDLFGEKLNEQFVATVVTEQLRRSNIQTSFWMLAPDAVPPVGYTLYLQANNGCTMTNGAISKFARALEQSLEENYHYKYCRRLGQLAPCRVFLITQETNPSSMYLEACASLGQRVGDIKPTALHSHQGWSRFFMGMYV